MTHSLARAFPGTKTNGGLAARLRGVPDELWERRALLLTVPAALTAAYVVLLSDLGISLRAIVIVYAEIAVFTVCIGLAVCSANAFVPTRLASLAGRSRTALIFTQSLAILAGVIVGAEIGLALIDSVSAGVQPARTVVYGLGFVFGYLAEGITFLFYGLSLRAEQGELHAVQARHDAAQARLAALQARTNPHFLFNSLNSIAGLVGVNPERAERAIENLSESMRYALESTRTARVPLEREIAAVRDHLELEKLRYADRLHATLDIDPGVVALAVPPLCLQPVIENAILHGIAQREAGGNLEVSARRQGNELLLRVDDDGPGPTSSTHVGTGTALADLRARLDILFGEASSLTVSARPEGGCRVELRIPAEPIEAASR